MSSKNSQLVYLSVGSNIERYRHVSSALDYLHQTFGEIEVSKVYESEAVGFEGDNFFNLVVGIKTDKTLLELNAWLKKLENQHGRDRKAPKFSARTLDVDVLTFGDHHGRVEGVELPRPEVLENAFVLLPLAELAGDKIHPSENKSYHQLWQDYDQSKQKLWPVTFNWQGRDLSA